MTTTHLSRSARRLLRRLRYRRGLLGLAVVGTAVPSATIALAAGGPVSPVVVQDGTITQSVDLGRDIYGAGAQAHHTALTRTLRVARSLARERGTKVTRSYVRVLRGRSVRGLLAKERRLRHALREERRFGGAPDVALPAILQSIASCESGGNPRAIGGGGAFRGKYQFTYGTWASVGGSGDPAAAPEGEQDRRAALLLARDGAGQWPVCGR